MIVEFESNMSSNITEDIKKIVGAISIEQKLVNNIENDIQVLLNDSSYQLILFSPRVWGRISKTIKKDKRVKLIRFRISDSSWKIISKTLSIPFN